MILLKELKLNNFLSHENTTVSFKENEKFLLDGKSGSGKSSITEAILWAFYGKGRSDNKSMVRHGCKSASVSLKLIDGQLETLITRTISSAGKNTLIITQNTGSQGQFLPIERTGIKDTQEWIEKEFLKASFELFTNSVAYPQENENSFVKSTASRRKDLLLEIVRAGNFDELYEKARKALTTNELESAVVVSKIEGLEKVIIDSTIQANKYDDYKKTNDESSKKIDALVSVEKDLESIINNINQLSRQIIDKKSISKMLSSSINSINYQLDSDQRVVVEHKKINIEKARKDVVEVDVLSAKALEIEKELKDNASAQQKINAHLSNKPNVSDYTKEIELINNRLIPLIKDSGKCPSGDACPFVIPIKGQIDFLTGQITEKMAKTASEKRAMEMWEHDYILLVPPKESSGLYEKLSEIRTQISTLSESKNLVTKYELFETTYKEIQDREIKLIEEKTKIGIELSVNENSIKELEQTIVKFDINKVNVELSNTRVLIDEIRKSKEESSVGMTMAANAKDLIQDVKKTLVILNKGAKEMIESKESLEVFKEALSPRGIKAVIIDYLVPQLEERINSVLGQMSDFRIRLDTQKATADEEGIKEGLFITVLNDRKEELPFDSYSGGEKVKITMAISEALASLMSQVGFRILDEAINALDSESTQSFVRVLVKLQEKFPQVITVSHLQEIKDLFEKRVTIIKANGISKII